MDSPLQRRPVWALPARLLRRTATLRPGPSLRRRRALFAAWFIQTRRPQKPFFEVLHDLLDAHQGRVTLREVLGAAGEQTYGLLLLILSLPSLVPGLNLGAAPLGGLGIITLGCQMTLGIPHPLVPSRLQDRELHPGHIKDGLARLEGMLDRFRLKGAKRRPLNHRWMGLLVAWTGFLLAIPVPLPFGNIAPAGVLVLQGAALLEERPSWGWLGALGGVGVTVYFALSFDLIVQGLRALLR